MKFQDDISNTHTHARMHARTQARTHTHTHTHIRTSRNQYVPHFFKVGGIITRKSLVILNSDPWDRFVYLYLTLMSDSYITLSYKCSVSQSCRLQNKQYCRESGVFIVFLVETDVISTRYVNLLAPWVRGTFCYLHDEETLFNKIQL